MAAEASWLPLRQAWQEALYADDGFYRQALPRDHFRTSVHAGPIFAQALLELARRLDVACVVDVGAGHGELLCQLHELDPTLELVAVELRPRPVGLPAPVQWRNEMPSEVEGLVVANEVVDNVPCDVVEVDVQGAVRLVDVDPAGGAERLGAVVPTAAARWLDRWWPLDQPGMRAEVGLSREDWWAGICARVRVGACLAVDYGHPRSARPPLGSLASYRGGRAVPVGYAGDRDITADVAVDALRERVGGSLRRQADCLAGLGIAASRPPLSGARSDPAEYLAALARAGEVAELTASPGLGDFWWLLSGPGGVDVDMGA